MRDLVLYLHILSGLALIILPIWIMFDMKEKKPRWSKPLAAITAAISWLLLLPSAKLYLTFYPATKTLIKAGSRPWAHTVLMETKEHWGLLLPIIATTAAILIFQDKTKESKRWLKLLIIVSILMGVMGYIISNRGVA